LKFIPLFWIIYNFNTASIVSFWHQCCETKEFSTCYIYLVRENLVLRARILY